MLQTLPQSPSSTPPSVTASSSASNAESVNEEFTLRFSSKERVLNLERSDKDDIWAIGMTLIEVRISFPLSFRA